MTLTKKPLFLILFLFKELTSTFISDPDSPPKYDITKELNDTMVEILRGIEPRIVNDFGTAAANVKNVIFDQNSEDEEMFDRLRFLKQAVWANETRISYDFDHEKIRYEFVTSFESGTTMDSDQNDYRFRVIYDDNKLQIDDITAVGAEVVEQSAIKKSMKRFIASAISRNTVTQSNGLIRALNEACDNQPSKSLTSKYPSFEKHQQQQYYYLIPSVSSTFYNYKNITIVGLTNFKSLTITQEPLVYILAIENILGRMTTDCRVNYTTQNLGSNAELDFNIGSLFFSFEPDTKRIRVEARNYSVILAKSKVKFGEMFSAVIMETMEEAIGTSIMPLMTDQRTTQQGIPTDSIEQDETTTESAITHLSSSTAEKLDPETTTQSEENLTTKSPNNDILNSSTRDTTQDPLDYHISYNNVAIELISSNHSCPEQIQCQLHNDLKFTHKISTIVPRGKIEFGNESNSINFHAHVGPVNIFVTNPNTTSTEGDDSCEFQIHLNQVINVKSSPFPGRLASKTRIHELMKIKKKIDAVLIPLANSDIVRKIKSMVCSSFDLCSRSKKIINDLFDRFVHNVLKKSKYYSTSLKKYNETEMEN